MNAALLRPWMALRAIDGLGVIAQKRLIEAFGRPEGIFSASREELIARGELTGRQVEAVLRGPATETQRAIDRELRYLERSRFSVVTFTESHFPPALREIPDPPLVLYVSGALADVDRNAVAIVGSRHVTEHGRIVAEEIGRDLALAGFTIVSGLARGVDGAAHQAALSVGGRTIGVMGCGLDRTYPPEHAGLRRRVEENGAVLSEFPIGALPEAHHFPRRNRIISGLCLGVIVTEAATESGSLITAALAADQGREVFAVPGDVREENSRGTNGLIKQGAAVAESAGDVIATLLPQLDPAFVRAMTDRLKNGAGSPELNEEEGLIYERLSQTPMDLDALIKAVALPAGNVNAALLRMEVRGLVRQLPGPRIVRL
jgi:DNA processing protein